MKKAYIELHIAVFLFGFTAILGKLITLDAVSLVWWRVLIASVAFGLIVNLPKTLRTLPRKRIMQFLGIGLLLAAHWVTFFWSIKLANASVTLAALSTQTFFTAFFEPMIVKTPFRRYEAMLGLVVIPAMLLIVSGIDTSMIDGLLVGILSAFLVSLFATLNKRYITTAKPLQISFFELSGAWLGVTLVMPFVISANEAPFIPSTEDIMYLLVLGLVCTTVAYLLAVRSLLHLSAFASNLTINLEPVYGILLAWLILHENEQLSTGFYLGSALMICTVLSYPLLRRYFEK